MAFQYQVLLSILLIHATNALQCTICLDRVSCNSQPEAQECNADLVITHHRFLSHINPSLAAAAPSTTFKCYDLELFYTSELTGSQVQVVQKGCTYSTTNFCDGWNNDVDMTHCRMCDSGDACNNVPVQTTTTTVSTSTSTSASPVSTTTTTADPASTTTTIVSSTTTASVAPTSTTTANPAPTTTSTSAPTSTTTAANPAPTTTTTADPASTTTTSVSSTTTASVAPTSSTTANPASTTTSTSASSSTATSTTTTTPAPEPASAGFVTMSWMLVVGFALLHGLVS